MAAISVVIPTLGRPHLLRRVLDLLEQQELSASEFEVLVITDARESDTAGVSDAVGARAYRTRRAGAETAGASAARNLGWQLAESPVVLFLGDDILPGPSLVRAHLERHRAEPSEAVGVLGHVAWARDLKVTPFMRWLEEGPQFGYASIRGENARWVHFYTANVSVKRSLLERSGGFDESLPFLYEDVDLAKRLEESFGFRLVYDRTAGAEHHHPATLDGWRRRLALIARAEHRFTQKHPDARPYFLELFRRALEEPPPRPVLARLAGVVPSRVPWLGPRVWNNARRHYKRELAPSFLAAWEAEAATRDARADEEAARAS